MKALLHLYDLSFTRGSTVLFEGLALTINHGDSIGLVGHNGNGKSSLLSLIHGTEKPDEGEIRIPRGQQVAFVEQFVPNRLRDLTLNDAVLDALPNEQQSSQQYQVEELLQQMKIPAIQWRQSLNSLSGGEQNLALLARALVLKPQLLLMDEPGNHMDVVALRQLHYFLTTARIPALLMVSHNRELLDQCCNRTIFLRDRKLYSFNLPYEKAHTALEEHDQQAAHRLGNEQKEIKRLQSSARRLAQWGRDFDNEDLARKAKNIEKKVKRLENDQTFVSRGSGLELKLESTETRAKSMLRIEQLKVTTPDGSRALVYCDLLSIKPGDRIALLGENGTGKSTTLNHYCPVNSWMSMA